MSKIVVGGERNKKGDVATLVRRSSTARSRGFGRGAVVDFPQKGAWLRCTISFFVIVVNSPIKSVILLFVNIFLSF